MATGYEHKVPGQYFYEKMMLADFFPLENLYRVESLELEPSDVVIASYPKTGTTLLQEIVWLIRNNGDTDLANKSLNVMRVPFMELKVDERYGLDGFKLLKRMPHPRHLKTHFPYRFLPQTVRDGEAKVVYAMRNPKDQLVSYFHWHCSSNSLGNFAGNWHDFFEFFTENDYVLGFGNYLDHVLSFWERRDNKNVFIISFEDMVKDRKRCVRELAEFLECRLSDEAVEKIAQATSFDVMKENPATNMAFADQEFKSPFMRKGEVGDWVNYFTDEQSAIIDEMVRKKLGGTDVVFQYE